MAVIDLGPPDPAVQPQIATALAAAGLEPIVDDALAGVEVPLDTAALANAITLAQEHFGKLDCKNTLEVAATAIGLAAQRQAAGIAVPELSRAWTLVLLCADRTGDTGRALAAAAQLRTAGGSSEIPDDVWKKYPDVDTVIDRELVQLEITADVPNAEIWIDGTRAGTAPLTVDLPAGDHVIAAAAGARRGWAAGTAVATQRKLSIPTTDQSGPTSDIARRIASWKGAVPSPQELGWVMAKAKARVAIVRRGDTIEAFGRVGLAEAPRRLGEGGDGVGTIGDAKRIALLVMDRVQTWHDRAPDPDRVLLTEGNVRDGKRRELPTKWWVYASIIGALVVGGVLIYANDAGSDRQRIEVHVP